MVVKHLRDCKEFVAGDGTRPLKNVRPGPRTEPEG
jgi:hypothetical protein